MALCPYCLYRKNKRFEESRSEKGHPIYSCKNCGHEIPALYVHGYRRFPPVIVSLVGFTTHGKTVYIGSLFQALQELPNYWRGFHYVLLDDSGLDKVKDIQESMSAGKLPKPNRKVFPEPLLVRLVKMPVLRGVTLVIYDQSGEAFENVANIREFADYIRHSPAVLFVHSISPREKAAGSLEELVGRYAVGMAALGARRRKQHLIVAHTKADEISLPGPYSPLMLQLMNGSLANVFIDDNRWKYGRRAKEYLRKVRYRSEQLREFIHGQRHGGAQFLNLCHRQFKSNSHALVSALGERPVNDQIENWDPKQVIDPLLIVIDKSTPWWRRWRWRRWLFFLALMAAIIGGAIVKWHDHLPWPETVNLRTPVMKVAAVASTENQQASIRSFQIGRRAFR